MVSRHNLYFFPTVITILLGDFVPKKVYSAMGLEKGTDGQRLYQGKAMMAVTLVPYPRASRPSGRAPTAMAAVAVG